RVWENRNSIRRQISKQVVSITYASFFAQVESGVFGEILQAVLRHGTTEGLVRQKQRPIRLQGRFAQGERAVKKDGHTKLLRFLGMLKIGDALLHNFPATLAGEDK